LQYSELGSSGGQAAINAWTARPSVATGGRSWMSLGERVTLGLIEC